MPIAVGYITAHYLTFLIGDGQRILIAISDPFQQGWDLFGTAFWQVSISLAAGGGDLAHPAPGRGRRSRHRGLGGPRRGRHAGRPGSGPADAIVRRQIPLAVLMVTLTVVTLWSLGQLVVEPAA